MSNGYNRRRQTTLCSSSLRTGRTSQKLDPDGSSAAFPCTMERAACIRRRIPSLCFPLQTDSGPASQATCGSEPWEDRERVIDDAAIEISWEQLRLKLESWEAFERRHQELPEVKSEIEPGIQSLAILYLFGSDNTPTFDPRGFIDPKLIASWSKFAADDRSSRYHTLISSLVANINEQNQTITQQDRFLFARVGMGDSFDQWWRLLQLRLTER